MKKLLVATAVSAAFAAPATVLAQQARIPTLGQVLDASGLSVNGYIDAGYNWANRNVEAGVQGRGVGPRVFDNQNNSFSLHQLGLTVAKQPKEGFGGLVNVTVGQDAQVIHSFPESVAGLASSNFDITQGYLSYSKGSLTLIGGKFTTLAGSEVIASPGNNNISRSILFGAVPFTHTGMRASWAPSDTFTVYGGLNNGWDQLQDTNRQKTLELGASFNPVKPLTMTVSGYFGNENVGPGGAINGERDLLDFVLNYAVNDGLSFGAELLTFRQDIPGGTTAKYDGLALYGSAMLNAQWRASARGEYFDDKNGFHFNTVDGAGAPLGVKYYELTLTLGYLPTKDVELRTEVRANSANQSVYVDGGSTSKTLMTFALQGLYKF
jgi:hypothetical protein